MIQIYETPSLINMKKVLFIFSILIVGISGLVLFCDTAQAVDCPFLNCEGINISGCRCGTNSGMPISTGVGLLFCCEGNGMVYVTKNACQVGACAPVVVLPAGNGGGDDGGNGGPSIVSGGGSVEIKNPIEHDTFEDLVDAIVKFVFYIALAIAPIMIIVAGFFFLTSAGDPKKIETAKAVLMYTLVGLAICLMATAIIKLINDVLGV